MNQYSSLLHYILTSSQLPTKEVLYSMTTSRFSNGTTSPILQTDRGKSSNPRDEGVSG